MPEIAPVVYVLTTTYIKKPGKTKPVTLLWGPFSTRGKAQAFFDKMMRDSYTPPGSTITKTINILRSGIIDPVTGDWLVNDNA